MACNVQIPVDDIADEVKQLLNLDQYVKQDNGTANNLTLKGGVTLDSATKQDLCEALANCFDDNYVVSFTRSGSDLTITLDGGQSYSVSLSDLASKQEVAKVNQAVEDAKQSATAQDTALFDKLSALIDALRTAVDAKQAEQDKNIVGLLTADATTTEKLNALSEKVTDMAECLGCGEDDDEFVNNALITSFDVNERAKTLEIRLADKTTFSIAGSKLAAIL